MTIAQILDALTEKPLWGERVEEGIYEQMRQELDEGRRAFVEEHLVST